jgi:hypothetical protein
MEHLTLNHKVNNQKSDEVRTFQGSIIKCVMLNKALSPHLGTQIASRIKQNVADRYKSPQKEGRFS